MFDPILERLRALEPLTRSLEPASAERAALTHAAVAHAESFLSWMDTAPAYRPDEGSAAALASAPIGRAPIGMDRALSLLARYVDRCGQNTTASGFFAFIPVGNLHLANLGEFLAAVSNRFSGHVLGAPGAVRIENQVLRWLGSLLGYPETAVGNLLSGGSMANLSAIVIAREASGIKSRDVERSVVYLTEQAHHCVTRGLRIAGVGECVIRWIPIDEHYRMIPVELDRAISEDTRAGLIPWLVVGTAGTTNTGAVDPLEEIATIAARHQVWFHCDGAYGGPFALCVEGKRILQGIERSDSVAIDPHKGLFVPFGMGALLVKDAAAARAAYAFQANYIPREALGEDSPTELSPELSRPFRALRLWLPLQVLGTEPFEAAMEEKLLLARYAHARLRELDGVEVGPVPDLSIVVFRALPQRGDPDDYNMRLVGALQEDGRTALSPTTLKGIRYVRFAILSPRTHKDAIDRAMEVIGEKLQLLAAE
jgi:glutamate/tyrosine decarboxylase-like PLP-dependent enzyme